MPQLHNKKNRRELKQWIHEDDCERMTLSFYKYFNLGNPNLFRDYIYQNFSNFDVLGRIYVAKEGINAQISLPTNNYSPFKEFLSTVKPLHNVRLNVAVEDDGKSFFKLTIKVKEKIVADGLNDDLLDVTKSGDHLDAKAFNKLIEDKNTIVVDMRNHYESEIGHFKNAITPDVDTFREALTVVEQELKDKRDMNIVMYCTGGIRCEKASAYYKKKGFTQVFQLDGGIINYARQVEEKGLENKFVGKNFVFDERLGESITHEIISHCHQCGEPCDSHTNCKNDACHLLFIQCDNCKSKNDNCCSTECSTFLQLPDDEQLEIRKKIKAGRQVFKKGRESDFVKMYKELKNQKPR